MSKSSTTAALRAVEATDEEPDHGAYGEAYDVAGDALSVADAAIADDPSSSSRARRALAPDEFFERQPAAAHRLPNPEPLLINLTRCVIEILAGARELEQISRWVTDDVYRHLLKRVVLSARARQARGQRVARPSFTIGSTRLCTPHDGVVEAVVIVSSRARTRAVAIRLEGLDDRWRATAINVL